MRARLMLGPLLYLALVGLVWLDQRLDSLRLPSWLDSLLPGSQETGSGLVLILLAATAAVLAARELTAIIARAGVPSLPVANIAAALLGLAAPAFALMGVPTRGLAPSLAVLSLVVTLLAASRRRSFEGITAAVSASMLCHVYLGVTLGFLLQIRYETDAWTVLLVLSVTKAGDIGAYFTGKAIGRRKLIPWLSPGKTWEGLVGGLVFAALIALAGSRLIRPDWSVSHLVLAAASAAILFTLVGLLGDLAMSLLKRDAGLKDSSRALPGYGGVLDLIDSPLLVAPVAYWWVVWLA